jgi:hypothetical protein
MFSGSSEEKCYVSGMFIVLGVGVRTVGVGVRILGVGVRTLGVGVRMLSATSNGCQYVQRHGTGFLSDRLLFRKKLHKPKALVL